MAKRIVTFKPYLDLSGVKKSEVKKPEEQNTSVTAKDFEKSVNKAVPNLSTELKEKEVSK